MNRKEFVYNFLDEHNNYETSTLGLLKTLITGFKCDVFMRKRGDQYRVVVNGDLDNDPDENPPITVDHSSLRAALLHAVSEYVTMGE